MAAQYTGKTGRAKDMAEGKGVVQEDANRPWLPYLVHTPVAEFVHVDGVAYPKPDVRRKILNAPPHRLRQDRQRRGGRVRSNHGARGGCRAKNASQTYIYMPPHDWRKNAIRRRKNSSRHHTRATSKQLGG